MLDSKQVGREIDMEKKKKKKRALYMRERERLLIFIALNTLSGLSTIISRRRQVDKVYKHTFTQRDLNFGEGNGEKP